jgi:hypothetical protein
MIYAIFLCIVADATCEPAEPPRMTHSGVYLPGTIYDNRAECERLAARYGASLDPRIHSYRCFQRAPAWQATR